MSRPAEKWSCLMCTYENYQASLKCTICHHPRGAEVIKVPPANNDKPLLIKDLTSEKDLDSSLIISPGCSSQCDVEDNKDTSTVSSLESESFLIKKYDDHPSDSLKSYKKSWLCGACTFVNVPSKAWCSQCRTPKDNLQQLSAATSSGLTSSSVTHSEIERKWFCPSCTYQNWNASKRCVLCRHDQLQTDAQPSLANANDVQNLSELSTCSSGANFISEVSTNYENQLPKSNSDIEIVPYTVSNLHEEGIKSSNINAGVYFNEGIGRSRSSSSSSNDHQTTQDESLTQSTSQPQNKWNWRQQILENQESSSMSTASSSQRNTTSACNISRSSSGNHIYSSGCLDIIDNRSFKNRTRNLNWLFLKACIGVVDGNAEVVDAYLAHGGNIARTLTVDEINCLNRPSAFDIGHTLVHLAIRFQRHNILALLLTPEIAPRGFKRNPSHLSPDLADLIRRQIMTSLRTRKGDFHCRFLSECTTFQLPIEICDLPPTIQKLLFDELLDQDVQKELEEESAINWSTSLMSFDDCNNRLYSLWNRSAGDCLLDSVLQATWGVFDRDNVLRTAMSESLQDCATSFFKRWREWELYQASLVGFSLTERQCLQDWAFIHSLAQQPGASLEHCHIFVLSHILRRPIIVYGIKYLKSFRGDTLGFAKFQGVYLPFLWERSFCFTSPIALGYTRGHFTALVTMENNTKDISARHRNPFNMVKNLPLVDSDCKILPIHFTVRGEGVNEDQRKEILQKWLDCHMTDDGLLVARQHPGKRPPSVTRLIEEWLDHYRHLSFRCLREEGDTDDDEE